MKKLLPKTSANPQGFTLVELMVVIAIIAILSAIGMTIFSQVQVKARDSRRIADIQAISDALEIYYGQNNSKYPADIATSLDIYISGGSKPKDPTRTAAAEIYKYTVIGTGYVECGWLEKGANGGNSSTIDAMTAAASGAYYCVANRQ